ncbi:MAG: hypothetical protein IT444_00550 [Phycisphaeraceae bacterium]|nr:hypothetical protein [Phycisphaeraceae bacterium]
MNWHPPLSSAVITILVLAGLAAMAASYVWARRQLNPLAPAALATIGLRLLAFFLLLFFLLQPMRLPKPTEISTQRTLAVLIDTSGSMSKKSSPDAPTRLDEARRLLTGSKMFATVAKDAKLAVYSFDDQPTPIKLDALASLKAEGRETDLGSTLEKTVRLHEGDDLAGIVMMTDGRNTQGVDPRTVAEKLKVPLYTLALGDAAKATDEPSQRIKDLMIDSVSADPRIIVGRTAQVVVSVVGIGYDARQVTIELIEDGHVVSTSAVAISPQQTKRQALFSVRPATVGEHKYQVRISPEDGEANPANNLSSFKVEVVDPVNRLIYLDRLRSERKFIKPMLESRRSLRFTAIVQQDDKRVMVDGNDAAMKKEAANFSAEQLAGVKAVIIGDLPAAALTPQQVASLKDWVDKGGALLLLAGPASMGPKGFATTPLLQVMPVNVVPGARYIEQEFKVELTPDGAAHPAFQKVKSRWDKAAPLLSRFEVQGVKPAATVLLATADVNHYPIVVSQTVGHGRVAMVLTDSTWRWQLGFDAGKGVDPSQSEHAVFWRQLIDWLLPDMHEQTADTSQVQVIADRVEYEINDRVTLMATVRGSDGSVIRDAVVDFLVATPDGRPIKRQAKLENNESSSVSGETFSTVFDVPTAGQYDVQAVARVGEQTIGTDQITLSVIQPVIEFTQTDPDKPLLQDLAKITRGKVLEPSDLGNIIEIAHLEPRKIEVQPNAEKDSVPAWDKWYFAVALLAIMSGEWFLRKKNQWV